MKVLKMVQTIVDGQMSQLSVMTPVYMTWKFGIELWRWNHRVFIHGKAESKCMCSILLENVYETAYSCLSIVSFFVCPSRIKYYQDRGSFINYSIAFLPKNWLLNTVIFLITSQQRCSFNLDPNVKTKLGTSVPLFLLLVPVPTYSKIYIYTYPASFPKPDLHIRSIKKFTVVSKKMSVKPLCWHGIEYQMISKYWN